jgi:hypothetical protein
MIMLSGTDGSAAAEVLPPFRGIYLNDQTSARVFCLGGARALPLPMHDGRCELGHLDDQPLRAAALSRIHAYFEHRSMDSFRSANRKRVCPNEDHARLRRIDDRFRSLVRHHPPDEQRRDMAPRHRRLLRHARPRAHVRRVYRMARRPYRARPSAVILPMACQPMNHA